MFEFGRIFVVVCFVVLFVAQQICEAPFVHKEISAFGTLKVYAHTHTHTHKRNTIRWSGCGYEEGCQKCLDMSNNLRTELAHYDETNSHNQTKQAEKRLLIAVVLLFLHPIVRIPEIC